MDPRLYPSGKTVLPTATTDTETTDTDKIAVYRGNQLRSISLANLFLSVPNNLTIQTLTATGTVAANTNVLLLNHASVAIVATIAAPSAGRILFVAQIDAGIAGHTVVLTSGTWDGTNETATLDAQLECIVHIGISATRFNELINKGTVLYS